MPTHFFNNQNPDDTLYSRLKNIAGGMGENFNRFLAVVGYFRSTGYFRLRAELDDVREIKILVGINIDNIFANRDRTVKFLADPEKALNEFQREYKADVSSAYGREIEQGLRTMLEDLVSGCLEIRVHPTRNLHAKFYLCLPDQYDNSKDGRVIMGSSNISLSGLGLTEETPRYELNVEMRDFDDVDYCHSEFCRLWDEAVPVTAEDIAGNNRLTYLDHDPTPWEIFMRVLILMFGPEVRTDFSIEVPEGVKDLSYQRDAVLQGYNMLLQHRGFYLADVVGLGKTFIATMVAKRFIEANGSDTHVLVVTPNAVEQSWHEAFEIFKITKRNVQFITNGSLNHITEPTANDNYWMSDNIHLVIVDEAHNYRNDGTQMYNHLQRICQSPIDAEHIGRLGFDRKGVILLSATPMNNRPADLLNQLLLFQEGTASTIDGVPNLKGFFDTAELEYGRLMDERRLADPNDEKAIDEINEHLDALFRRIREEVVHKITIRRTRSNIENCKEYREDLKKNGIRFPELDDPRSICYELDRDLAALFRRTLHVIQDENHTHFARYRAYAYLTDRARNRRNISANENLLKGIFRIHLVKRLESSFTAFQISLRHIIAGIESYIQMWNDDRIVVTRDTARLLAEGHDIDYIIRRAAEKHSVAEDDITFSRDDFRPDFINDLNEDLSLFQALALDWQKALMRYDAPDLDPKLDSLIALMPELFNKKTNPGQKLVMFTESADTMNYLAGRIAALTAHHVLAVSADNYKSVKDDIRRNFDANIKEEEQKDDYDIIITTEVLAEGVNLHRANVIVNYDTPWNATRLMQRVGRVNRIGSRAEHIYSYMCYPSAQGDSVLGLFLNELIKLQSFHNTYGEDARVYSPDEIVHQFQMFTQNPKDGVDARIRLLRLVRDLYQNRRDTYEHIASLPAQCRCFRPENKFVHPKLPDGTIAEQLKLTPGTLVVMQNMRDGRATLPQFYYVQDAQEPVPVDFIRAAEILEADEAEQGLRPEPLPEMHYSHVEAAAKRFELDTRTVAPVTETKSSQMTQAEGIIRQWTTLFADTLSVRLQLDDLRRSLRVYNNLANEVNKFFKTLPRDGSEKSAIITRLEKWAAKYPATDVKAKPEATACRAEIIISETFI